MVDLTPDTIELKDVNYVVLFGSRSALESQQQAGLYRTFLERWYRLVSTLLASITLVLHLQS